MKKTTNKKEEKPVVPKQAAKGDKSESKKDVKQEKKVGGTLKIDANVKSETVKGEKKEKKVP